MPILFDFQNKPIRLTEERINHIIEHPEMANLLDKIEEVIKNPQRVIRSMSDLFVHLYYRFLW